MALIITIARFALVPFIKIFLRTLGFGSLGPLAGKDIYFKNGKWLTFKLKRIIFCVVANIFRWKRRGREFLCALIALRDGTLIYSTLWPFAT
jgi:hypothetical protein